MHIRRTFFHEVPQSKLPAGESPSASLIHSAALASEGIRKSPLGDSATLPTLGPSGRHERLNCPTRRSSDLDRPVIIQSRKSQLCHPVYLCRRISAAKHIIQEKVVQLIRPHQVLRLLGNHTVYRRKQFRTQVYPAHPQAPPPAPHLCRYPHNMLPDAVPESSARLH